jgi:hypothetical protein
MSLSVLENVENTFILPPQCASGPLGAGDPHVPLHRRRDDGDSSGHVAVVGPSL